tara:strand:+ start:145 stop:399 length:255 start_codon:yes stop_codon:yes gene_type:complete
MDNIKLMIPQLSHLQDDTLKQLTTILNAWLDNHGLPRESANEVLLTPNLTDDQKTWLRLFIDAWDGSEEVGRFESHLKGEAASE